MHLRQTRRGKTFEIWEDLVQKERIQNGRWIALGDLNWPADKAGGTKAGILMARADGLQHRVNLGTRWGTDNEIDWVWSNTQEEAPKVAQLWLSDHKMVEFNVNMWHAKQNSGSWRPHRATVDRRMWTRKLGEKKQRRP